MESEYVWVSISRQEKKKKEKHSGGKDNMQKTQRCGSLCWQNDEGFKRVENLGLVADRQ